MNEEVCEERERVLVSFFTKYGVRFMHALDTLGVCRGVHVQTHASYYVEACIIIYKDFVIF